MKSLIVIAGIASFSLSACRPDVAATGIRASGHVDATEVRVAAEVGGRRVEMKVNEGYRDGQGDVIATLDTRDIELAIQRARAERAQAEAQLRLLQAGARAEDIRQAEAQATVAAAEVAAGQSDLRAAELDLERFEKLLETDFKK